ncbi:MAG: SBBP repeat-containing protein [Ignavibacteria bacterium]|nr:SBBP repeat-containing protein [Ignavibacteria bacterium]
MKAILFTIFYLIAGFNYSQENQIWVARYNEHGNYGYSALAIAVDASGNIYVTGAGAQGTSFRDYVTVKYNSSGVVQWMARYNGTAGADDIAEKITVDGSGNVYVTGSSYGSGQNLDYLTIKYNSSGVEQWTARHNGPGSVIDEAHSIAVDAAGNVYVTGESRVTSLNPDYATIKYNSSGIEQWVSRYNGPANNTDIGNSLAVDGAGNVYVTGESRLNSSYSDYATIKYNSSGVQQWVKRYDGTASQNDRAIALKLDAAANVYITGSSAGTGSIGDIATIKYNSSGDTQWTVRYNGPDNLSEHGNALAVDAAGNVYVTGRTAVTSINTNYITLKYNSSGVQQWVSTYDGPGNSTDESYDIAVDLSGNVYITGESTLISTNRDYATIKYNTAGVQQWLARYNGPGNAFDAAKGLVLDQSGNVIVTGVSYTNSSGSIVDYATIKYSVISGIQQLNTEIPGVFSLSQNYPNPFNPVTNIEFSVPKSTFVKLAVFDVSGRELETLVSQNMTAGTYKADWDASKYSSGVYFYRLETEGFSKTSKMILVK